LVECEVERLLAVIGGKWKVLILSELFHGARRHAAIRKALPGISQKVLTAQLRELELDGALARKDFAAKRPHVEYSPNARTSNTPSRPSANASAS
jgi:DNA-binding HxlR family transcriptional regulator